MLTGLRQPPATPLESSRVVKVPLGRQMLGWFLILLWSVVAFIAVGVLLGIAGV